jgi:hypothetical protein
VTLKKVALLALVAALSFVAGYALYHSRVATTALTTDDPPLVARVDSARGPDHEDTSEGVGTTEPSERPKRRYGGCSALA